MANAPTLSLTPEEADAILGTGGMFSLGHRPRVPEALLVEEYGDLTAQHYTAAISHIESGKSLGITTPNLQRLRHSHHRIAQLLAMGMPDIQVSAICNMTTMRISILKNDPAFSDLIAHYSTEVQKEFTDFVSAAKVLSMDMLGRLSEILDETPDRLSPAQVIDAIKVLADRTGNAPISKNVNINVHTEMGDRLRAARERAAAIELRALNLDE